MIRGFRRVLFSGKWLWITVKNKEEGELKLQMLSQFAAGTSAAAVCSSVKKCKVKERERELEEMAKQMVAINHQGGKCDKESQLERKGISRSNGKQE